VLVASNELGERLEISALGERDERGVIRRHRRIVRGRVRCIEMERSRIKRIVDGLLRRWIATCDETRESLSAHLEGELEGREAKRVLRHLVRCERCREVLRSLARVMHGLHSLGRANVPAAAPSTADSVVDRIRRGGF
jgi:hypothetical protein